MQNKTFKTKDMMIAVFCSILAVLAIVFYFLPAFNIQHTASIGVDYETVNFSAWNMTQASFTNAKVLGSDLLTLLELKDAYSMPIFLAGILSPLAILSILLTTTFAYLAWLKNENFKKFCFMCGLVGMMFATISLIAVWFMALKIKTGEVSFSYLYVNIKGNISYGAFVSLIISFVVAIIACAYNYFIDSDDDDEEEDEEDEEEEEEEPKKKVVKTAPKTAATPKAPVAQTSSTKAPATKTTATKSPATKSTTTRTVKKKV